MTTKNRKPKTSSKSMVDGEKQPNPNRYYTHTDLRKACVKCICNDIPDDKLGRAIAELPELCRKVSALKNLERAFMAFVADFRKLDVRPIWWEIDEMFEDISVSLLPTLKLFGIDTPKQVEGTPYQDTIREFCSRFGINAYGTPDGNDVRVQSKHVLTLFRMAGYPKEIVRRFEKWFHAFVCEKEIEAGWHIEPSDNTGGIT